MIEPVSTLQVYTPGLITSENTFLYLLSGKTYQSFPSGLERVTATFAGVANQAARLEARLRVGEIFPGSSETMIQSGDGFRETDNFYIFPAPEKSFDVPGFVKFNASAYRLNPNYQRPQITLSSQFISLSQNFEQLVEEDNTGTEDTDETDIRTWTVFEKWRVDSATYTGVVQTGRPIGLFERVDLGERLFLVRRRIVGEPPSLEGREIPINWVTQQTSVVRRNFGRYDEFDSVETLIPEQPDGTVVLPPLNEL